MFMSLLAISFDDVMVTIKRIALSLDGVIYGAITWMYSVFLSLAGARLLKSTLVTQFIDRIYIIISIAMLFIVAYSFLNIIINPDNMSKGNVSPSKLITNILLSLVLIMVIPSIFSFGFAVQKSIVRENIVSKIIIGSRKTIDTDDFSLQASDFSATLFETNFYPINEYDMIADDYVKKGELARAENNIGRFGDLLSDQTHAKMQYNFVLSGIVGIYVLYTLLIFSIDAGLRIIKLFFYEMVAPIPALLMIVPGQDKAIKAWTKAVIKTYFDLFIKLAVVLFGVFVINVLAEQFKEGTVVGFESTNRSVILFAKMFICLGVVMFMRRAPKLIEDLFGFKFEEHGLSLTKRLNESGITFLAGAGAGMIAGAYASVKGAKMRGANKRAQVGAIASGMFHGARLGGRAGWNGSLHGIGEAHSYAIANQAAWAHMDPNKKFGNGLAVAGEMLRDNIGMKSYYDSLVAYKEIEFNKKNSAFNRAVQNLDDKSKTTKENLENKYRFDTRKRANDVGITLGKDVDDTAESEILKDSYEEKTTATVAVRDKTTGKIKIIRDGSQSITAKQIKSLHDMYADAADKGEITREEENMLYAELENAKKRLKSDYMTNNMLMRDRDAGFTLGTSKSEWEKRYISDFVDNMKSYNEYADLEKNYKKAQREGRTADAQSFKSKMDALETQFKADAKSKFDIILSNIDDYKANLNMINKITAFNDAMDYTGSSRIGVDKDGIRSADIKKSDVGSELLKAIKMIKIANSEVENERQNAYRKEPIEYVDENGNLQTITLGQYDTERARLSEEIKKITDALKDFKLAHVDEEQAAKMAQEKGKYRRRPGGKSGS